MNSTTTTYTDPAVLTTGVAEGWADSEPDPALIDWAPRRAAAIIPFSLVDGHPVNPCQSTGMRGRNQLGRWGENLMADALVTVTLLPARVRYLLMIERDDGYGWAVPGGSVEPGESGIDAARRELADETGLWVSGELCRPMAPRYIPDPRGSDEAWAVTLPVKIDLGERPGVAGLPEIAGDDDARRAEWIPASAEWMTSADPYELLVFGIMGHYRGRVFPAHVPMLTAFLAGAR